MSTADESRCGRCLRTPDARDIGHRPDAVPVDWEVKQDNDGNVIAVICPNCLTPEERQAIDEDSMELSALLDRCSRCGRFYDDADDSDSWVLTETEHVCTRCWI